VVQAVAADSRQVQPGTLFVALPGERTDGHDHAPRPCRPGAVAVLCARPLDGLPCLVVPDPLEALQAVASGSFAVDQPWTVGITGSSGKTSTKDLLAHLLRGLLGEEHVLAPQGSFNNELGPAADPAAPHRGDPRAVLEYSARGVGHIAFLCRLAGPTSPSSSTSAPRTSASSARPTASPAPRASSSRRSAARSPWSC
jgi:UDP-N-acetylmuramoyl-tripeptide--D-alanyl-D-alanine ligase